MARSNRRARPMLESRPFTAYAATRRAACPSGALCARVRTAMVDSTGRPRRSSILPVHDAVRLDPLVALDPYQEFLVQPVDASWLQCNIECQEACPVGTNCRG